MDDAQLDRDARPFRGSTAVRRGVTTPGRLHGPTFQVLGPDLYGGADLDPSEVRVRLEVADLWAGPRGVVAGPLAALAHGAECPWEDAEVVVACRGGSCPTGLRVRTDRLAPHEVTVLGGIRVTSPERTAFDLARRAPLVEAVAAVDALGLTHRVGRPALDALAAEHPRARGLVQVRQVAALTDRKAESLMESRMRVGLVLRGVPAAVSQFPVDLPDYGRARFDLAWPEHRFALEYDGGEHRTIRGQNRDNRRDAASRRIGWRVIRVSSQQILDARHLDGLAREVIAVVGR